MMMVTLQAHLTATAYVKEVNKCQYFNENNIKKKSVKWVLFCCTIGIEWVTVIDVLLIEFNESMTYHDCIRKTILSVDGLLSVGLSTYITTEYI